MKPRRLTSISNFINENYKNQGYEAKIVEGYCNTDKKVGRLRIPGKGRYGNKLLIFKNGIQIFSHNSAETYRNNGEVETWLLNNMPPIDLIQIS